MPRNWLQKLCWRSARNSPRPNSAGQSTHIRRLANPGWRLRALFRAKRFTQPRKGRSETARCNLGEEGEGPHNGGLAADFAENDWCAESEQVSPTRCWQTQERSRQARHAEAQDGRPRDSTRLARPHQAKGFT